MLDIYNKEQNILDIKLNYSQLITNLKTQLIENSNSLIPLHL